MEIRTRIRINLKERELELEGSESFIDKYQNTIAEFIEKIKTEDKESPTMPIRPSDYNPGKIDIETNRSPADGKMAIPDSFGEFYTQFPRNAKVVDKMLIASLFAQMKSEDGLFTPSQAAELLDEQNVNITNANSFIKALQNTGKLYKQSGKFKVHEKGIEFLKELLTSKV